MKKCFIVCPIGEEGSEIRKRSDQLFKYIIDPVCKNCDFEAVRVDKLNASDSITQTIIDYLNKSELVIADITDHNPNAFYEMGYRASTGKHMIHLKQKGEKIPFDISSIRAFEYDLQNLDAVDEVKKRLENTIESLNISENDSAGVETIKQVQEESNLLPVLYEILDNIEQLKEEIHKKDTETIQAIVKASQPEPVEDPMASVMKALIPEMIKNPNSMKTLMELGSKEKGK